MAREAPSWVQNVIEDGWAPVKGDPDGPLETRIVVVEAGPRRRMKAGQAMKGGKPHALYKYVAPEVALVLNEFGEYEYVPAGGLDTLSGQRVHRDEQDALPWGATNDIDQAFVANNRAAAARRRPRTIAGRIGEKTIGR